MYINSVISCNGGWDILAKSKPAILAEIKEILSQFVIDELHSKRLSFRPGIITPLTFHRAWDFFGRRKKWLSTKVELKETFPLYIRSLKDRVSIKMNASDPVQFPNWLFVETQKTFDLGIIDVAILLVPMEAVSKLYEVEDKFPAMRSFIFQRAKVQLEDLQPLRTIVPLVVIGFSPESNEIDFQEIKTEAGIASKNIIDRCIEFRPEQYQAGMSILAYFGKILEQKHPGIDVKVRIEQDKNHVRMHIETPDGMKSVIEKTLEDYSLVISNQAAPETLLDNKIQILQLQNKLESAVLEVKQTHEFLKLTRDMYSDKVSTLEEDIKFLRSHLGLQLSSVESAHQVIENQSRYHRDIVVAQIEISEITLDSLIKNYSTDFDIRQSLEYIKKRIEVGINDGDRDDLVAAATVIASRSPSILQELGEAIKGTVYGATGNVLYQWILPIIAKFG